MAAEWRAIIIRGEDPKEQREANKVARTNTVDSVWDDFYGAYSKQVGSHKAKSSLYKNHIQPDIGHLPIDKVNPPQILAVLRKIAHGNPPKPAASNDALRLMENLFSHAVNLGYRTYNPAANFKQKDAGGREKPRSRKLLDTEFTQLFEAMRKSAPSLSRENYLCVALLLVLGVRKMELQKAKWRALDLKGGLWRLSGDDTKTDHPIVIPLEPEVIAIFKELKVFSSGSECVFPARRKTKSSRFEHVSPDTLNAALKKLDHGLEHHTVHDLRRSCRTALSMLGVSETVAERYINHKVSTYNLYDYLNERREAQRKLIDYLWPLTGLNNDQQLAEFCTEIQSFD